MSEYVVVHGSIKTEGGLVSSTFGLDGSVEKVGIIDVSEKEAKLLDSDGTCLQLKSDFDADQAVLAGKSKKKAAPAEPEDAAEEPAAEPAKKAGKSKKKGG